MRRPLAPHSHWPLLLTPHLLPMLGIMVLGISIFTLPPSYIQATGSEAPGSRGMIDSSADEEHDQLIPTIATTTEDSGDGDEEIYELVSKYQHSPPPQHSNNLSLVMRGELELLTMLLPDATTAFDALLEETAPTHFR